MARSTMPNQHTQNRHEALKVGTLLTVQRSWPCRLRL
jgi:hypothetical protein